MVGHRLVDVGVGIGHGGPEHRTALYGRDDVVEVMEARAAALLRRREVHEEGVEPGALRREEAAVLIVMHPVELAGVVLEDLERLEVALAGHLRQVGDAVSHSLRERV